MTIPEGRKTVRKSPFLLRTAKEFAGRTTVHGISYIADKQLPQATRLLWLAVCLLCAALAATLTLRWVTHAHGAHIGVNLGPMLEMVLKNRYH